MPLTPEQQAEIDEHRATSSQTRRASVPALEEILYEPVPVLDHGFVRVIDYMGDDAAIVQAARVSYGKGTKKVSGDRGLIRYLMRHRHTTPFEMCEIKFHVKLPVFVARQWIRHRTANVNEYSARYSILDREFYIPAPEQLAAQSVANRQGRGEVLEARHEEGEDDHPHESDEPPGELVEGQELELEEDQIDATKIQGEYDHHGRPPFIRFTACLR